MNKAVVVVFLINWLIDFETFASDSSAEKRYLENCSVPLGLSHLSPCSCHHDCRYFSDCCHVAHVEKRSNFSSCVAVSKFKKSDTSGEFVWLVDHCPPSWDSSENFIRRRCVGNISGTYSLTNPEFTVPVSNGRRLFKNAYCAFCHNADFIEPKVDLICHQPLTNESTNSMKYSTLSSAVGKGEKQRLTMIDHSSAELEVRSGRCHIVPRISVSNLAKCFDKQTLITECASDMSLITKDGTLHFPAPYNKTLSLEAMRRECRESHTHYIACDDDSQRHVYRNPFCAACRNSTLPCRPTQKWSLFTAHWGHHGNFDFRMYRYDILLDIKRLVRKELKLNSDFQKDRNQSENSDLLTSHNDLDPSRNVTDSTECCSVDYIAGILGLVCSIVSILALIILLGVYIAFPLLRNLAGLLTISLGTSLLIALICFVTGPFMAPWLTACRISAMVMYFSFISSFAWMSIFAFDLVRTFTTPTGSLYKRHSSHNDGMASNMAKWRRYLLFSIVGWLVPLMLTCTAAIVDFAFDGERKWKPHFGVERRCFFGSGMGLLVWFYVPVTLMVCANCVLIGLIFRSLWHTFKKTHTAKLRRGYSWKKSMALLCLKVTLIFGTTWLLGLLAAWTEIKMLRIIAGVANSLQGLCVSVSFLASRKVSRRLRKSTGFSSTRSTFLDRSSSSKRFSIASRKSLRTSVS